MRGELRLLRDRHALALSAQAATDQIATNAVKAVVGDDAALEQFLGPLIDALAECLHGLPDIGDGPVPESVQRQFAQRLAALIDSIPALSKAMDTRGLEEHLCRAMFAGDANGRLQAAVGLPG